MPENATSPNQLLFPLYVLKRNSKVVKPYLLKGYSFQ